jgi:hypothetical protein
MKEMGIGEVEAQPLLKVSRSTIPEETRIVVLEYKR